MSDYLLTITPPKKIIDIVDEYRRKYARYSGYIIPPHITLYPPFYLKSISEKELIGLVKNVVEKISPEVVNVDSVNYFENGNNVVYFEPNESSRNFIKHIVGEIRTELTGKVENKYGDYPIDNFTAHMTIAEHIPSEKFEKIKKELANFKESFNFEVNSVYLYKQEPREKEWKEVCEIKF